MPEINEFGQTVGDALSDWTPRPEPERVTLAGRYVTLKPLTSAHFSELYDATCGAEDAPLWSYLPRAMPTSRQELWMHLAGRLEADPMTFTVVPAEGPGAGKPAGIASLLAVEPEHGSAEVGWILFGRALRRTRAATEAIHLLSEHVLGTLGYRRLEWKCNSLNEASRRAAARFGFTYEGRFRAHRVIQGRNRDTDWFSLLGTEWPAVREAQERWLDEANFDADGRQKAALESFTSWDPRAHNVDSVSH